MKPASSQRRERLKQYKSELVQLYLALRSKRKSRTDEEWERLISELDKKFPEFQSPRLKSPSGSPRSNSELETLGTTVLEIRIEEFHSSPGGLFHGFAEGETAFMQDQKARWVTDERCIPIATYKILEFLFRQCLMHGLVPNRGSYHFSSEGPVDLSAIRNLSSQDWFNRIQRFVLEQEDKTGHEYGFEPKSVNVLTASAAVAKTIAGIQTAINGTRKKSWHSPIPMSRSREAEIMNILKVWVDDLGDHMNRTGGAFMKFRPRERVLELFPENHPFFTDYVVFSYACWEGYTRAAMQVELIQKKRSGSSTDPGRKLKPSEKSISARVNQFISTKMELDIGRQFTLWNSYGSKRTPDPEIPEYLVFDSDIAKSSYRAVDSNFYEKEFSPSKVGQIIKKNQSPIHKKKLKLPFDLGLLNAETIAFLISKDYEAS